MDGLQNIFSIGKLKKLEYSDLLNNIVRVGESFSILAFGNFGKRLHSFATSINLTHPEICCIFDGAFSNDHQISKKLNELLELSQYSIRRNMSEIGNIFQKAAVFNLPKEIKNVDNPLINHKKIRLLKSTQYRIDARKAKQSNEIYISRKRIYDFWDKSPDDFNVFFRHNELYKREIEAAEFQAIRFENLGCFSNVKIIREQIEEFQHRLGDVYYGFRKITILEVLTILAKKYKNKSVLDEVILCPICQAEVSKEITDIVSYLDCFPELGGLALFDNYLILTTKIQNVLLGERDEKLYFIYCH